MATKGPSVFFMRVWPKHVKDMGATVDLVTLLPWMEIECANLSLIPHCPHVLLLSFQSGTMIITLSIWASASQSFQLHVSFPVV